VYKRQDITPAEDLAAEMPRYEEFLRGGRLLIENDKRYLRKDGETIFVHISARLVRSAGGEPDYFLSVIQDVTQQTIAERSLRESEARFKAVSEYAHNAICLVNEQAKIVWVNEAFVHMSGYSKERMYASQGFDEFLAAESIPFVLGNFECFLRKEPYEHHYTFYFLRADGEKRLCEKHMVDYEDQFGRRILAISMMDITERRRAEEQLLASQQSYEDVFHSVSEAIYIQDKNGMFLNVNKGAAQMYRCSREDLIGKTPADVSAPGRNDLEEVQRLSQGVFETGQPALFEFWGVRAGGQVFPKEVIFNKGRYFGRDVLITTARDITERKQAEAALRESTEELEMAYNATLQGLSLIHISEPTRPY
jgi:PAS domain S-box-containing protein